MKILKRVIEPLGLTQRVFLVFFASRGENDTSTAVVPERDVCPRSGSDRSNGRFDPMRRPDSSER